VTSTPSALTLVAEEFGRSHNLAEIAFQGKGAFKETFRAVTSAKEPVALKILQPAKCDLARSQREIEALQRCDSPLIARLYDHRTFSSADGNDYYVSVEEYLDGGTLTQRLSSSPAPDVVRSYGRHLTEALSHLKSLKLVHRDIKPDNIMFRGTSDVPVLVDFGLVRDLSASSLTQTWLPQGPGTPYYAAPEQLNNEKHLIGWRTDQFSVGVVLGICLTGQHPFTTSGLTVPQTVAAVARRDSCSDGFRTAADAAGLSGIVKMLAPWPVQRYATPAQLLSSF
jgi:serine/threonine protein kinase